MRIELTEKRTATTKTYSIGGGKFELEVYRSPIHYQDADGNLQDVENVFAETATAFELLKTDYPLRIKKDFSQNRLVGYNNNHKAEKHAFFYTPHSLLWLNKNNLADRVTIASKQAVQGVATRNKVLFTGAFGAGFDFEVTATSTGFKKEIILQNNAFLASRPSAQHFPVFITKLKTTSRLFKRIAETDRGQNLIELLNTQPYVEVNSLDGFAFGEQTETFITPASIIDSSPLIKIDNIRQFLIKVGTDIYLGKVLPIPFLETATYPVRSDATTNGTINQDNWIDNNQPTKNWNGELTFFRVGDQGGSDGARGIARFTMPANPGGTITDVAVQFKIMAVTSSGTAINLHHGTNTPCTAWSETQSTWNVYSTGNNWTASGAASDFSSTIVDTYTSATADDETFVSWYLYGSNATNPITVTWNDVVNIMLRAPSSSGFQLDLYKDEDATNKGKIVVTYTTTTSVTVSPAAQVLTASIPAYTVKKGVTQAPAAQALTASIPTYAVRLPKTVSPVVQTLTFNIPTYVIDAGGNISIAAATQVITASIPAYALQISSVISPNVATASFSLPTPVITAMRSIIISVATQVLTFTLPTLAKVGGVWRKRARETNADWTRRSANDT